MATIVIEASKVIDAANDVLTRIEKARKLEDEKTINDCIENSKPGRIRKFFGAKEFTREQAIASIKSDKFSPWWFPSERYHKQYNHVKVLRLLAAHGDPVTLNEFDADMLFG